MGKMSTHHKQRKTGQKVFQDRRCSVFGQRVGWFLSATNVISGWENKCIHQSKRCPLKQCKSEFTGKIPKSSHFWKIVFHFSKSLPHFQNSLQTLTEGIAARKENVVYKIITCLGIFFLALLYTCPTHLEYRQIKSAWCILEHWNSCIPAQFWKKKYMTCLKTACLCIMHGSKCTVTSHVHAVTSYTQSYHTLQLLHMFIYTTIPCLCMVPHPHVCMHNYNQSHA